jgi:lipopolysaccharide export system permease protein
MGLCFLIGVGLRLAGLAVNNVVTLHAGAVPFLYVIPLAAIGVSLVLIARGARPSRGVALDAMLEAISGMAERLGRRFGRRAWANAGGSGGTP